MGIIYVNSFQIPGFISRTMNDDEVAPNQSLSKVY